MKKSKAQKGITLVALIITIVILLILAAVAIDAIQNENILSHVKNATEKYNQAVQKEQEMLNEYTNFLNDTDLEKDETEGDGSGTGGETGGGTEIGDATVGTKVDKISTIDGKQYTEDNPVIPEGFIPINTPTSSWDATDLAEEVKKGLVITDSVDSDGVSNGNEFVWIPVANINNMIMCQSCGAAVKLNEETLQCPTCGENTKIAGKLYATMFGEEFESSLTGQTYGLNAGLREPDVITIAEGTDSTAGTSYDAAYLSTVLEGDYANTQTAASFKLQLEAEFKNMAQSVAKYKGFYVGRYEMSYSAQTSSQSKSGTTPNTGNSWYIMYNRAKGYSRANEELGVVSEMIWGCEWDAMMQLILTGPDANHVTAKTNVGHTNSEFTSKPYKTGGTNYTEVYTGTKKYNDISSNIYDLEGNITEWTQEALGDRSRVSRGGYYYSDDSPSYRGSYIPTNGDTIRGTRLTIYVKL